MKNKKVWMTASLVCIILGVVVLAAGRLIGGYPGFYIDNEGVHSANEIASSGSIGAIQGTKELEPFSRMEIAVDYADVELVVSDRYAVDYCIMKEYAEPVCEVKNDRLIFKEADSTKFRFFNVGFFTNSFNVSENESKYYVKVEIPADQKLSEASFDIESGILDISALQADSLNIVNEYGDINLDKYEGTKLDICLESGTLFVGSMNVKQAEIKNEYGDINISNAQGEQLTATMESCGCQIGRMDFSNVKMTNEYGDISLGLSRDIDDYSLDLYTEYGDICVENEKLGYGSDDDMTYRTTGKGKQKITASCESGNIEIHSAK